MGVFTYSAEEGTAAAGFDGQIDEEIKEQRRDKLMTLQQEISFDINKSKLGTVMDVLCEGYDEESFMYFGRSEGDGIDVDGTVYFAAEDEIIPGQFVPVEILDCDEYDLTGKVVDDYEYTE